MKRQPMAHERLDVYQRAIEFLTFAHRINKKIPRSEAELKDQLHRASLSIPLNIAEGVGKTPGADRSRFHTIARGSSVECAALMDAIEACGFIAEEEAEEGKMILDRIVAMLSKMIEG